MSLLNVTRDIRKLAEEAERNKEELATAGLGLGGGFVASQTGGSAKNPNKKLTPLEQKIAENDARNQSRTKNSTPKPNIKPQPEFKIDRRTKEGKQVIQEVVDKFGADKPPVVKDDPLPNTKRTTGTPKPTGFRGNLINTVDNIADFGKGLTKFGKELIKPNKLGPQIIFEAGKIAEDTFGYGEKIGGMFNIDEGMQDYFSEVGRDKSRRIGLHKFADASYDTYNFAGKALGDLIELPFQTIGAGYDFLTKQPGEANLNPLTRTFKGETYEEFFDDVSPSGAGMYARRPNPEMSGEAVAKNFETGDVKSIENVSPGSPAIPLSDRSELERQIIRNQQGGQPLLAGTFEDQAMNKSFGGEGVPIYQGNFLERKQQEEPITDAEFQKAQQFALKRGMVFDSETGYSKADFFGQMYKGQTIGQFLRGEDAPEGFTDVIGQTADPRQDRNLFEQASKEREERLANRPDFMEAVPDKPKGELSLGDYRNLARAEGFKGSAQIAEAKRLMKEDQSKDELTPYQKEQLKRSDQSADLAERRFQESIRQYKEGESQGKKGQELDNLYTTVKILGLLNDIEGNEEELDFDFQQKDVTDFVGVLDEFGVDYDPETNIYKRKGKFGFGKQLTKEELAELSPLLKETKFIKLLEYTSKNNQ
jgi:hypothetical protein